MRDQQERGGCQTAHTWRKEQTSPSRVTYRSYGSVGPEPLPHPSSLAVGRETEQGGSGRPGTAEYLAPEICAGSTNLHLMVLSSYSSDDEVGKLGQVEFQGRLGFQLLVESRDPYLAALGQKLIPVCSTHWFRQWRQAQQLGSREQLFPPPRHQYRSPTTPNIA